MTKLQGTVSGRTEVETYYYWPTNGCRSMRAPELFVNVGSFAEELWDILKTDGGYDCQEAVEI